MRHSNTSNERAANLAFAVLLLVALFPVSEVSGIASLGILGLLALLGQRLIGGFWRTLAGAALAGGLAGLVILGPGFRLAMRVVAILDNTVRNEFTLGGTMFIIIFIGGMLGAVIGVTTVFARRGLSFGTAGASLLAAAIVMGFILLDSELGTELRELGAGFWVNFPMFGSVAFLYGLATQRLFDRFRFATKPAAQHIGSMA